MSIVYCKERATWPVVNLFKFWLYNVEYDGDSIFIIVSDHALMRVGCISDNHPIFLRCKLGRIIIFFEFFYLFLLHLLVLFHLTHCHFHSSILNYVVRFQITLFISHHFFWLVLDFFFDLRFRLFVVLNRFFFFSLFSI